MQVKIEAPWMNLGVNESRFSADWPDTPTPSPFSAHTSSALISY